MTWRMPDEERSQLALELQGKDNSDQRPLAITNPGEGGKFDKQGSVLHFPGNTFLCHIDPNSRFFLALCDAQDALKTSQWSDYFTFLPRPSFHMTIFCGISGTPLGIDGWPKKIAPGTDLETITNVFEAGLAEKTAPQSFSVIAKSFRPYSIRMAGTDATHEQNLRNLRDELRDMTGLVRDDHATYEFHVSIAYLLRWMPEDEAEALVAFSEETFKAHLADVAPVEIGPCEFCNFENMHHFNTRGLLVADGYIAK